MKVVMAAGVGAALLVAGAAYGLSGQKMFYQGTQHGPRPAPDCHTLDPPCPPSESPQRLISPMDESVIAFLFLPPPPAVEPVIDAAEAVDIAWQEGGFGGTSQQATLALIPPGDDFTADILAWIVRYEGYCSHPVGIAGDENEGECVYQPNFTLIDATTGDFIMSWTRPEGKGVA